MGVLQLAELVSQGQTYYAIQFQFPGTLSQGDTGPEVEVLQYMLSLLAQFSNSLPAPTTDGDFGPETDRAVRSFQVSEGLTPDGIVDERTWNAIYDNFVTVSYSLSRDTVRAQALGADAVPVMATVPPEPGPDRWADTPRLGQYQGRALYPGQKDGQVIGQEGVKV